MKNLIGALVIGMGLLSIGCQLEGHVPAEIVTLEQSQPAGGEESLRARIDYDIGRLEISSDQAENMYALNLEYDKARYEPRVSYETDGVISHNIICTSPTGGGVYKGTTLYEPTVECNDIWGNHPYNQMNLILAASNFSQNPMFCDPVLGDYRLCVNSLCVDGYGCGQVGAFGVGCGWTLVKQTTWSSLKAAYR